MLAEISSMVLQPVVKTVLASIEKILQRAKYSNGISNLLLIEAKTNLANISNAIRMQIDIDALIDVLENKAIMNAVSNDFNFNKIKSGKIKLKHIKDVRNKRLIGKNCEWLFNNLILKIQELKDLKKMCKSVRNLMNTNITLKITNLLFKYKLLIYFIK